MKQLTKKQEIIYNFICSFFQINHNMPSYRDIAVYFDMTVKGAWDHVQAIIKKGFLERKKSFSGKFLKFTKLKIKLED